MAEKRYINIIISKSSSEVLAAADPTSDPDITETLCLLLNGMPMQIPLVDSYNIESTYGKIIYIYKARFDVTGNLVGSIKEVIRTASDTVSADITETRYVSTVEFLDNTRTDIIVDAVSETRLDLDKALSLTKYLRKIFIENEFNINNETDDNQNNEPNDETTEPTGPDVVNTNDIIQILFKDIDDSTMYDLLIHSGERVTVPVVPESRDGFTFEGWSTLRDDKNGIVDLSIRPFNENTTLWAIWKVESDYEEGSDED